MKWQRTQATLNLLMYSHILAFHYTRHLHLDQWDQCDVPDSKGERISQLSEQSPSTPMTNLGHKTGLYSENTERMKDSTTYPAFVIVGNSIWSTYIGSN
jgi:hypothetical protein